MHVPPLPGGLDAGREHHGDRRVLPTAGAGGKQRAHPPASFHTTPTEAFLQGYRLHRHIYYSLYSSGEGCQMQQRLEKCVLSVDTWSETSSSFSHSTQ